MTTIYRKVILGHKTNFFRCDSCLNEANEPKIDWVSRYVEDVVPGEGNPGVWEEAPLEQCDMCYRKDENHRKKCTTGVMKWINNNGKKSSNLLTTTHRR